MADKLKNGIPDIDITKDEAIRVLKDVLISNPLISLTKLGKAIIWSIKCMEESK